MISTKYIYIKLEYYFSQSQRICLQLGKAEKLSVNQCFDLLQQTNWKSQQKMLQLMKACFCLQSYLVNSDEQQLFTLKTQNAKLFNEKQGMKVCLLALRNFVQNNLEGDVGIIQQMVLKSMFNLFYINLFYWYTQSLNSDLIRKQLKEFIQEMNIDSFLIKVITMTLQAYYIPVRKLVILYTRILSIIFDQLDLYEDSELMVMAQKNLLTQDYLKQFRQKNSPKDVGKTKCPVKKFYAKHNVKQCPLAQSIVVGFLRSLLTICNSQIHKKLNQQNKNTGVDSYRQWQITYRFLKQYPQLQECLSNTSKQIYENYIKYNQSPSHQSPTHFEFTCHKIYTATAISTFFSFLLLSFKKSTFIHFTYLYQLISDANGILVFLKFLTSKFDMTNRPEIYSKKNYSLTFENQIMLAVFSVLLVLYGACNNYPQKARSYLFQYNSYLIIKKIPHLFMNNHKNDEELPSQKQLQEEFAQNLPMTPVTKKVKQLTVLCYELLKLQIPFFSKKSKENSNNVRMIVDVYCQLPRIVEPIRRSQFEKILLKSRMKKIQQQTYIRSVQQLKVVHNQYNNQYYWANDSLQQKKLQVTSKLDQPIQMDRASMEAWLQQNVWRYYD